MRVVYLQAIYITKTKHLVYYLRTIVILLARIRSYRSKVRKRIRKNQKVERTQNKYRSKRFVFNQDCTFDICKALVTDLDSVFRRPPCLLSCCCFVLFCLFYVVDPVDVQCSFKENQTYNHLNKNCILHWVTALTKPCKYYNKINTKYYNIQASIPLPILFVHLPIQATLQLVPFGCVLYKS